MTNRLRLALGPLLTAALCFAPAPPVSADSGGFLGSGGGSLPPARCLTEDDERSIAAESIARESAKLQTGSQLILFADPLGNGGMNAPGQPAVNYVDLDPTAAVGDFKCGTASYDGHGGNDILVSSFFEMDEGVAILAAAPGVVSFVHDGEFDRQTAKNPGAIANRVTIDHADGTRALYYHMRKGSVRVQLGQSVQVGDTLGFVGSSGSSTAPHLHFEVRDAANAVIEPYNGPCQGSPSQWASQPSYIRDMPFAILKHGVTTIPLTWPVVLEAPPSKTHVQAQDTIISWLLASVVDSGDVLRWELRGNGNLWNSFNLTVQSDFGFGWWFTKWFMPVASSWYGSWSIKLFRNGIQVAEQNFTYDASTNQLPSIAGQTLSVGCGTSTGTFEATDPDGSIFWHKVQSGPFHGTLTQTGGRWKNYSYTPNPGFVGQDSVEVYAVDDEDVSGLPAYYVFSVSPTCCCVGTTGNVNAAGIVDLSDLSLLIAYLTVTPKPAMPCLTEANVNGASIIDLSDLSLLISYLTVTPKPVLPNCP